MEGFSLGMRTSQPPTLPTACEEAALPSASTVGEEGSTPIPRVLGSPAAGGAHTGDAGQRVTGTDSPAEVWDPRQQACVTLSRIV